MRIRNKQIGLPYAAYLIVLLIVLQAPLAAGSTVVGATSPPTFDEQILGAFPKWSTVEIPLTGPNSTGMNTTENPFLIEVNVTFTGPGGESFVVPAFYDGNGNGGLDGNVWRVRFSPGSVGSWQYNAASTNPQLNGHNGTFTVTEPAGCSSYVAGGLPDFGCVGRLEYVGDHYLKFADGPYWLKGGADDPEDFLAPGQTVGFATKEAAIDYLAGKGVNSLYIMLHNVGGDGNNVWPWVGETAAEAKENHRHFDVARLAEWEAIFTYLQQKGIVLHLVFEDDSGWTGFDRALYYREMIARFGHHNGLYWNISEEFNENYSTTEVKSFAQQIKSLDAYNHPLTVHHAGPLTNWNPFVGHPDFDLTSFQTGRSPQNSSAEQWFNQVLNSGRTIPIAFDETGKIAAADRTIARHIVWSVFLGGANFEMHTSPLTSYTQFADHFTDMHRARTFMENLPLNEMRPANTLLSGPGYLFTSPGQLYVAYLSQGGTVSLDLSASNQTYEVSWFNPRTGVTTSGGGVTGGAIRAFTAPDGNDWVLVVGGDGTGNVAPFAVDGYVTAVWNTATPVNLLYEDSDGPGPYTFTIVQPPSHGSLTGGGANRTYTPDNDFTGTDSFTWRVNDGLVNSNLATTTINVVDPSSNQPPLAEAQTVQALNSPVSIQLQYSDPDNGPGPYTITITRPPQHGTLSGTDNDRVYTPAPGFAGTDQFSWRVNDGLADSETAAVTIQVSIADHFNYLPVVRK